MIKKILIFFLRKNINYRQLLQCTKIQSRKQQITFITTLKAEGKS